MNAKIRYFPSLILGLILMASGSVRRAKKKALEGEYILSIYFHSPSKKLFESCIRWLVKNNFCFISVREYHEITNGSKAFPKGAVLITVDDGWKSNKENIASIANKFNVPVTIFLATEPIEEGNFWWSYIRYAKVKKLSVKPVTFYKKVVNSERIKALNEIRERVQMGREALTIEEIKEISKTNCISFGSHTVTHPILIHCTEQEAYEELNSSKRIIEEWIEKPVSTFAYPNGDYSEREIEMLKKIGYEYAFSIRPKYITRKELLNKYQIPRFCIVEEASLLENICRMVGVWQTTTSRLRSLI